MLATRTHGAGCTLEINALLVALMLVSRAAHYLSNVKLMRDNRKGR